MHSTLTSEPCVPIHTCTNDQVYNKVSHSSWGFSFLYILNKIVIFLVAANLSNIIWQEKVTEISCSTAMLLFCWTQGACSYLLNTESSP